MARHEQRPPPAAKSKTDLRRGQFTPGMPSTKRTAPARGGTGTTPAEQAILFDEPPADAT
jgi:hypothetical protein